MIKKREPLILYGIFLLFSWIGLQNVANAQVDQATYDLVRSITQKTFRPPVGHFVELAGIESVKIVGGEFSINTSKVETFPTQFEDKVISLINCRDENEIYKQEKTIETDVTTSVEINETVSTSTEFKAGLKIGGNAVGLDSDILQKTNWQLSSKTTQTERKKVTEKIDINRTVAPRTALILKARMYKGYARAPIDGNVILDAVVQVRWDIGFAHNQAITSFSLSDPTNFNTEPQFRTTPLRGFVYSQTYERTDQIVSDKPIDPSDPICKDSKTLKAHPLIKKAGSLIVLDGLMEPVGSTSPKDAAHAALKETTTITIKNEDLGDLFVWVRDMNVYGGPFVLNGARLNQGASRNFELQLDGSGEGRISWRVQRYDDERRQRSEEDVVVKPESTVDVTTRFQR